MGSLAGERVLLGSELLGPHRVSWNEKGVITLIEPCALEETTRGSVLCPGFVSLQVNGVDEVDVREAKGEQWSRLSDLLLAQGVTSWFPTVVSEPLQAYNPLFEEVTAAIARQPVGACDLVGLHVEGPFLGVPGAHRPSHLVGADLDWVSRLPACVRIMTLAPEQKLALEATSLLAKRGVVIAVGHSKATAPQVDAFVAAGGTLTTHLFNAMSGVHHRNDGLALTVLTNDSLYADIIVDLQHVSARAVSLAFRAKPGRMVLVTDSISHLSPFTRSYYAGADIPFKMEGGAPHLDDGTLAGATVRMNECVQNCVEHCNVSLAAALYAASSVPAQVMRLADRGAIGAGLRADLVLLDSVSFTVLKTICQGVSNPRNQSPQKRAKV